MSMRPLGQKERSEVCSDDETRRKSGGNRVNERVEPKLIQQHLLQTDSLILNSSYVIVHSKVQVDIAKFTSGVSTLSLKNILKSFSSVLC